jgi:hypothetical protein
VLALSDRAPERFKTFAEIGQDGAVPHHTMSGAGETPPFGIKGNRY